MTVRDAVDSVVGCWFNEPPPQPAENTMNDDLVQRLAEGRDITKADLKAAAAEIAHLRTRVAALTEMEAAASRRLAATQNELLKLRVAQLGDDD